MYYSPYLCFSLLLLTIVLTFTVRGTTLNEILHVYTHLRSLCPIWYQQVILSNLHTTRQSLHQTNDNSIDPSVDLSDYIYTPKVMVELLDVSFKKGAVLCELISKSNENGGTSSSGFLGNSQIICRTDSLNPVQQPLDINSNLHSFIQHFGLSYFTVTNHFQNDSLYLDFIIGLIKKLNFFPPFVSQAVSYSDALDEFVATESDYANKLIALHNTVESMKDEITLKKNNLNNNHNNQNNNNRYGCSNFIIRTSSIRELADFHHQKAIQLQFYDQPLINRVITFFYAFLQMENLYKLWISHRCESIDILDEINEINEINETSKSGNTQPNTHTAKSGVIRGGKAKGNFDLNVNSKLEESHNQFLANMLAPLQRLCKYPLLLKEIAKFTKDVRFQVLEKKMDQLTLRINDVRRTTDTHHKIVNWSSKTIFLQTLQIRLLASVYLTVLQSTDSSQLRLRNRLRLACRYDEWWVFIKETQSDSYLIAGMILNSEIEHISLVNDKAVILHTTTKKKLQLQFEMSVQALQWYDFAITSSN